MVVSLGHDAQVHVRKRQATDAFGISMEGIGAPHAMRGGSLRSVSRQNWRACLNIQECLQLTRASEWNASREDEGLNIAALAS